MRIQTIISSTLCGVWHEDVTTTKKAIENWEDRLQAIEGRLDKMSVISEPSTSRSMFGEPWLLK